MNWWNSCNLNIWSFQFHTAKITCIAIEDNLMFTSSLDQTIKIWMLPELKQVSICSLKYLLHISRLSRCSRYEFFQLVLQVWTLLSSQVSIGFRFHCLVFSKFKLFIHSIEGCSDWLYVVNIFTWFFNSRWDNFSVIPQSQQWQFIQTWQQRGRDICSSVAAPWATSTFYPGDNELLENHTCAYAEAYLQLYRSYVVGRYFLSEIIMKWSYYASSSLQLQILLFLRFDLCRIESFHAF